MNHSLKKLISSREAGRARVPDLIKVLQIVPETKAIVAIKVIKRLQVPKGTHCLVNLPSEEDKEAMSSGVTAGSPAQHLLRTRGIRRGLPETKSWSTPEPGGCKCAGAGSRLCPPSITAPLWDSVSTSGIQGVRDEALGSPGGEEQRVMSLSGRPCALDPAHSAGLPQPSFLCLPRPCPSCSHSLPGKWAIAETLGNTE